MKLYTYYSSPCNFAIKSGANLGGRGVELSSKCHCIVATRSVNFDILHLGRYIKSQASCRLAAKISQSCLLTVDPQSNDDHQTMGSPVSVSSRRPPLSDASIGAVVGALATLAFLLFFVAGLLAWRRQRQFGVHRVLKCLDGPLQVTSVTNRPPNSPRLGATSQFNGTANGLAVAAKVPCILK